MIGSKEPSLNADGTRIALTSNGSLAFDAPSSLNIYLFDTTTSAFTRVSNTQLILHQQPSISARSRDRGGRDAVSVNGLRSPFEGKKSRVSNSHFPPPGLWPVFDLFCLRTLISDN